MPINTMDKKTVLQTVFAVWQNCRLAVLHHPRKTWSCVAKALWALQPTDPSAPAQSFGISAETCYTWHSSEEWCRRRFSGPLSMLDRAWEQTWHFSGPALRNMDHGKPTDIYQQEAFTAYLREQKYNLSVCGSIQFIKLSLHSDKHSSPT